MMPQRVRKNQTVNRKGAKFKKAMAETGIFRQVNGVVPFSSAAKVVKGFAKPQSVSDYTSNPLPKSACSTAYCIWLGRAATSVEMAEIGS
jgi:hypothetical protein